MPGRFDLVDEAFDYKWLPNRLSKIRRNREAQFADHVFPLAVIGALGFAELGSGLRAVSNGAIAISTPFNWRELC
jgi:hypothetical protein